MFYFPQLQNPLTNPTEEVSMTGGKSLLSSVLFLTVSHWLNELLLGKLFLRVPGRGPAAEQNHWEPETAVWRTGKNDGSPEHEAHVTRAGLSVLKMWWRFSGTRDAFPLKLTDEFPHVFRVSKSTGFKDIYLNQDPTAFSYPVNKYMSYTLYINPTSIISLSS